MLKDLELPASLSRAIEQKAKAEQEASERNDGIVKQLKLKAFQTFKELWVKVFQTKFYD